MKLQGFKQQGTRTVPAWCLRAGRHERVAGLAGARSYRLSRVQVVAPRIAQDLEDGTPEGLLRTRRLFLALQAKEVVRLVVAVARTTIGWRREVRQRIFARSQLFHGHLDDHQRLPCSFD